MSSFGPQFGKEGRVGNSPISLRAEEYYEAVTCKCSTRLQLFILIFLSHMSKHTAPVAEKSLSYPFSIPLFSAGITGVM